MPRAQQLGRYQLLDRIAFGGMAEIFRAKTFDGEGRSYLVAVKRVLNHLTHDEEFLKMLVDEAKVTASLNHENIARVYEFALADGEYFIAMEYVDGKDVRALLERQRIKQAFMPAEHVAWIGMEVAHGLQAAHLQHDAHGRAMHIVHRDVSPSNVLCSYSGEVKLCDFGIAKATLTRTQTKTGVIKGKVKYMSPEQAMGRKLDHRSDLFSLGTCMYEMLTLEAPFQAPSEVELIFAVRDARRRPARSIVRTIPEELETILERLMSRSRSQRFQSGEELASALRLFLDHYRPGYRRSHFGRYMREVFASDIEAELRALEAYVIETADATRVGENLIADALPADAPYTKFTAMQAAKDPSDAPPLPDLHGQPTQILARKLVDGTALHDSETRMLSLPDLPAIDDDPAEHLEDPSGLPPLHALPTRILGMTPGGEPLPELATKILMPRGPANASEFAPSPDEDSQVETRPEPRLAEVVSSPSTPPPPPTSLPPVPPLPSAAPGAPASPQVAPLPGKPSSSPIVVGAQPGKQPSSPIAVGAPPAGKAAAPVPPAAAPLSQSIISSAPPPGPPGSSAPATPPANDRGEGTSGETTAVPLRDEDLDPL